MKYLSYIPLLLLALLPGRALAQAADEQNTLRLAQVYEQSGKYEEALRYYKDLYTMRPSNAGYFDGMRRCLTQMKRYDDVITLISERVNIAPREVQLYVQRGSAWYRKGDEKQALNDWDAAIALEPRNSGVYAMVADEAVNNKLYDKAVEYFLRGRKEVNLPGLFVIELARVYAMSMKFELAMDEYIEYLLVQPTAVWQIQQQLSMFSDLPEALKTAVQQTRRAAGKNSDNLSLRQLLAWLYMESKDYDAAFGVYRDMDVLRNAGGMEILQFAQRAYNDKAYAAALRAYRELVVRYPDAQFVPEAEFWYARCVETLAEIDELPPELRTEETGKTTRYPSSEAVKSYQGAVSLYEEVVRKYRNQSVGIEARFRIASIKFTQFHDNDGALQLLTEIAPMRRPITGRADADILIGDIYVAKGDLDAAMRQYQSVLSSTPIPLQDRETVQFKIGEVHFFQGDFDNASKDLEPLTVDTRSDIANDALSLGLMIQQYLAPSDLALKEYARAMLMQRQQKYSEAAAVLQNIIARFPTAPLVDQASITLGMLYRRTKQHAEAERIYEEFLAKNPDSILKDQILFQYGLLEEESIGNPQKAMELYQRLLNEQPNSVYTNQARERIIALRKGNS